MMMLARALRARICRDCIRRFAHGTRDFQGAEILGGKIEEGDVPIIFDRNAKRAQRDRAALRPRSREYDHLKDSIAARLADRLYVIEIANRDDVKSIIMCDYSEHMLMRDVELDKNYKVKPVRMVVDEEYLPFAPEQFDLIISNLSMQWINDFPGYFQQIKKCLKPDGVFLGSTFGENTLQELRNAFYLAEQEREGGYAPHTSPFTRVSDVGNLISAARMALPTIDTEEVKVVYSDMYTLLDDLQGMGENNAVVHSTLPRKTTAAASAIYHHLYSSREMGGIPATFQIVYMIGWGPHPSQQKPAARGSGKMHLSQVENMEGLSFGTGDKPQPIKTPNRDDLSLDDLFKPNVRRSTTEDQTTNQSETNQGQTTSQGETATSEEKKGKEGEKEGGKEGEREYVSEDFVISRIDSAGNMTRGKK